MVRLRGFVFLRSPQKAMSPMPSKLEEILAHTRLQVDERKHAADLPAMERRAAAHTPRGFAAALRSAAALRPAIIAELKKASPSKGILRPRFDPVPLALTLAAHGAAALSILTEERYFQGSLAYLEAASRAVDIPILRKDFMVDAFQVLEARSAGADAILLIVAAHSDAQLTLLAAEARRHGLDILCEAHTRDEIARAVQLGFDVIGVNSRNLKTLEVDPGLQAELATLLPPATLRVAESGVRTHDDILRLQRAGYDAFLIGESLMRQPDPGAHLATLLGIPVTA